MNFNVHTIPYFDKQLKRLVKKYPSLKTEFSKLIIELKVNPTKGTPLGHDCYKIRLAISSKNKGKARGRTCHYLCKRYREHSIYVINI